MTKKIIILVASLLVIGGNVFAQGDLQVNGAMSVGTGSAPSMALDVAGESLITIEGGVALKLTPSTSDTKGGTGLYVVAEHDVSVDKGLKGATYLMNIAGAPDNSDASLTKPFASQQNSMSFRSGTNSGTYSLSGSVRGAWYNVNRGATNLRNWNIDNFYGIDLTSDDSGFGGGVVDFTNLYQIHIGDFDDEESGSLMTATNYAGIWIDALDGATNNYGIVLDGDGAGSDLVFGDAGGSCRPSVYAVSGYVKAKNKDCVESPLSPHDPETGEWIFYSKNTKTGKTVRVNMEKMVKAIEKLTGEKFMIETVEDID